MSDLSVYEFAKRFSEIGVRTFPVRRGEKRPAFKGWQEEATLDKESLQAWFDNALPYNLGIATGRGLVVIDIDCKGDVNRLSWLEDNRHRLPETLEVETPSGGRHLYYSYNPKEIRIPSGNPLGKGIDIQSDGKLVVGPGSIFQGTAYTTVNDTEVSNLPEWLRHEIMQRKKDQVSTLEQGGEQITSVERSALMSLSADDYNLWVRAAMACKYSFGEAGFDLWHEWSRTSPKYREHDDCAKTWANIKNERPPNESVKFASIVHLAKENGWSQEGALQASLENIAVDRELTPSERRDWIACRMATPGLYPDRSPTAAGNDSATIPATIRNVDAAVKAAGLEIKYNVMTHCDEINFRTPEAQKMIEQFEEPDAQLLALLWGKCEASGMRKYADFVANLRTLARDFGYHPIAEYIMDNKWDGEDRFEKLAGTVVLDEGQCPILWRTYLRKWLLQGIQAVMGWREPKQLRGCLVLVGPQGCGKTTWFSTLAPLGSFGEGVALSQSGGSISVDSIRLATRHFITELGELETTFKRADTGALKNFLTARYDEYRKPYARDPASHPRATIFCGTVNHAAFLRDSSGSSRFLPLKIKRANGFHELETQQIWAQAFEYWTRGETWFLSEDEDAMRAKAADLFAERSPIYDLIEAHLQSHAEFSAEAKVPMNATDVLKALGLALNNYNCAQTTEALEALVGPRKTHGVKPGAIKQRAWLIAPVDRLSDIGDQLDKRAMR